MSRPLMSEEREMTVSAMRNMGWTAKKSKRGKTNVWNFTRSYTGGLWDSITIRQDQLSMIWVADIAMQHDDAMQLKDDIIEIKKRWLGSRFSGIYKSSKAKGSDDAGT